MEQSKKKEVQKRPVGRPKMQIKAILLPTKEEKPKATPSTTKARGAYTNWFVPSLWDPIYSPVSHHRSLNTIFINLEIKGEFGTLVANCIIQPSQRSMSCVPYSTMK
ncbi:hypothetical protein KC19_VG297100 [Ceratodon purpureus]|uniref:Uncharacterized protein n=1 Tax=Ceratodon purpureus TaxID=3225 RepID=A0A8T0HWL7_CERPU|nr:hypothetical protein KC19_VG297100 [Ceratodon purpureus]